MLSDQAFVKKVLEYYAMMAAVVLPLKMLAARELAPGVVAVFDEHPDLDRTKREYDVFFDPGLWGYLVPQAWESTTTPVMRTFGLMLLPGLGTTRPPRDFLEAKQYAQRCLCPNPGTTVTWYDRPAVIRLAA